MSKIHSDRIGGFSENDGTIDFYLRIRSLLTEESTVLDLGAGRAAWFEDDQVDTRRELRHIRPLVKKLIAIDVDEVVMENRSSTENLVFDGKKLPLPDKSIDVVVADFVLEHVEHPVEFYREVNRVLKDGGTFCARTPHKYNYVALGAGIISEKFHTSLLGKIQPVRKSQDVFPTFYRMNRLKDIRKLFDKWQDNSFIYRAEPAYFFGRKSVWHFMSWLHRLMPSVVVGSIFVFLKKPAAKND